MPHLRFHNGESFHSFQRSLLTAACGQRITNIGQLTDSREKRDILTGKTLMIGLAIGFLMVRPNISTTFSPYHPNPMTMSIPLFGVIFDHLKFIVRQGTFLIKNILRKF
jgi:hypothetical protein